MSKEIEEKYKKYLYKNFLKLSNCIDEVQEDTNTDLTWKKELISYNNIMGSLIGLIDGRGVGIDFKNCKDFVLKYYAYYSIVHH